LLETFKACGRLGAKREFLARSERSTTSKCPAERARYSDEDQRLDALRQEAASPVSLIGAALYMRTLAVYSEIDCCSEIDG
jgi:hypothetical protein